MKAICYKNTSTKLPRFNPNNKVHEKQPVGIAYELDTHFVHFYGWNKGFQGISLGLTVIEGKNNHGIEGKSLTEWVEDVFGAKDIVESHFEIGKSIKHVWRPGLYNEQETLQALGHTLHEQFLSEQALRVILQKLDEIFLFVEPSLTNKYSYGHRIRELLILCCTEVENFLNFYLTTAKVSSKKNGFSTNDYVVLKDMLFLGDFEFELISYPELGVFKPFENWHSVHPSKSLPWYDDYNKTKHDRKSFFEKGSLINVINAIVSCLIMHCVRFGPYSMFESDNHLSSIVKQLFSGRLTNESPNFFYIPKLELPTDSRTDRLVYDSLKNGHIKDYSATNFCI